MVKVKICGLQRKQDIEYVNESKPDYVGFVFAKSKRQVTKEQALMMRQSLAPDIKVVGVFVNATIEEMVKMVEDDIIDIIQLHGQESSEIIARIKDCIDIIIIQAFSINCIEDVQKASESIADYVLLDGSKAGSGQVFDWQVLARMNNINKPFFFAGGIDTKNVQEAIEKFNPYAIDVSSGVEENGYKSKAKIDTLIGRIRNV